MSEAFSWVVELDRNHAVAYLDGELRLNSVGDLQIILAALATSGRKVTVNLADVRFLGSAGMAALAELQRIAAIAGGSLRLAAVPDDVQHALAASGMQDQFAFATQNL
ncbi:MAG TPA: STAS domain-containing protein [Mycobacterium sp.]|jgi:anti-anti-sigma factor|nr:STAS domain-containing protein [Mycobacterium sp.]